jgi:hypothetical protein
MKLSRALTSLFLAFALLFAQQAGAAHAFSHALEQPQDKHAPDSTACDKCEQYAQMGNALSASSFDLPFATSTGMAVPQQDSAFLSPLILAAAARGPPAVP